jgi:hypothetical protein
VRLRAVAQGHEKWVLRRLVLRVDRHREAAAEDVCREARVLAHGLERLVKLRDFHLNGVDLLLAHLYLRSKPPSESVRASAEAPSRDERRAAAAERPPCAQQHAGKPMRPCA